MRKWTRWSGQCIELKLKTTSVNKLEPPTKKYPWDWVIKKKWRQMNPRDSSRKLSHWTLTKVFSSTRSKSSIPTRVTCQRSQRMKPKLRLNLTSLRLSNNLKKTMAVRCQPPIETYKLSQLPHQVKPQVTQSCQKIKAGKKDSDSIKWAKIAQVTNSGRICCHDWLTKRYG